MNRSFSSSDFSDSEDITFVKSEHEKILQNSNIYKQYEQTNNNCIKHPNKKAKFYVQHDRSQLFCSKCALNLALQGMKIEETQEIQLEQQRKNKISKFSENLNLALKNCDQKVLDLTNLISNLKIQFEEQQQNCCNFFDAATNTICQLKQTYLSKFSNDFFDQKEQIQSTVDSVKLLTIQLKQFREDIEVNHENIVKKMEMKPFQEIMSKYEKKVDETLAQLTKYNIQPTLKQITFEQGQILAFMNKMCYNLLLKNDSNECQQQIKVTSQPDQKLFEMLESEEIYQTTFSNPIKDHSYIFSPIKAQLKQDPINQNTIRSQQNTPESSQQKLCIQKTHFSITPNEKDLPLQYSQRGGELSAKKVLQKQLNDKFGYQISEKQKTTTEYERGSENSRSQWNNNISCLQLQKFMKDIERGSLEGRELSPKQQIISKGTVKLQRETKHITQKSQQLFANNQGLKQQFDSVPNLKVLASQSHENQLRFQSTKQQQDLIKRSKSKQPKQQSTDQTEGRRQYILAGQIPQYQSQQGQSSNEETLKDRILKELCSHPGESVYSQVLKSNQKQRNAKILQKENCEWSSTRNKSNGYTTNKKQ